jgi:hypothetical protein
MIRNSIISAFRKEIFWILGPDMQINLNLLTNFAFPGMRFAGLLVWGRRDLGKIAQLICPTAQVLFTCHSVTRRAICPWSI